MPWHKQMISYAGVIVCLAGAVLSVTHIPSAIMLFLGMIGMLIFCMGMM